MMKAKLLTLLLVAAVALPSELNKAQVKQIQEFTFTPALNLPMNQGNTRGAEIYFYTLQVLDLYTTYKGLQYACIEERNPLLSNTPELPELLAAKVPIALLNTDHLDLEHVNIVYTTIVYHNYDLWRKADRTCIKR